MSQKEPTLEWIRGVVSAALVLLFLAVTLSPIVAAAVPLFRTQETLGVETLLESGRVWRLLLRSVILAGTAATLSSLLGVALGISLFRCRPKVRLLAAPFCALTLFLSPAVVGAGAVWLLGPKGPLGSLLPWHIRGGLGGPAFLLVLMYTPLVGFLVFLARRTLSEDLVDAARLNAKATRVFSFITLPLLLPYVAVGWLLVFLLSLFNYALPSLCRWNVLATELVLRFSAYFDPLSAGFLSFILSLVGILAAVALRFALPAAAPFSGSQEPPSGLRAAAGGPSSRPGLNAAELAAGFFSLGFALFAVGIPLAGQLTRMPALSGIPRIVREMAPSLLFSCAVSAAGAFFALVLGFLWALQARYGRLLRNGAALFLGILPLCLPGELTAVGLIRLLNRPLLSGLLSTGWGLILARAILNAPYAFLVFWVTLRLVPREEIEAALLSRSSTFLFFAKRLAPAAAFVFWLSLCLGLGETDVALMLTPPGTRPLSVVIYTLYHFGSPGDVAVLSVLLFAVTAFAVVGGFAFFSFRKTRGGRKSV